MNGGANRNYLDLIESFHHKRLQGVVLHCKSSNCKFINFFVTPGSVLGPL